MAEKTGGQGTSRPRVIAAAFAVAAIVLIFWIRMLPLSLDSFDASVRSQLTFPATDGRERTYLGGHDSYDWLRQARTYLRTGSVCDATVDGNCHDTYTLAPVGGTISYPRSLHVRAIVFIHRIVTFFAPEYPLPGSAFLLSVIVGTLGTLPAFAIGRLLAGNVAGLAAALVMGVNPLFLLRSIPSDNDVWNVVLPLCMVWAALAAATAIRVWKQALWALVVNVIAGAHALTWDGWVFGYAVVLSGLGLYAAVLAVRSSVHGSRKIWQVAELRSAVLALVFLCGSAALGAAAIGLGPADLASKIPVHTEVFAAVADSTLELPDAFTTVDELARPHLAQLASLMGGAAYFFAAWLGLLLLCLPRRDWRSGHFALLIGGNCLYWYLLTQGNPSRPLLLCLLALPLVAALVAGVASEARGDERRRPVGIVVIVWFLAALFLAFDGLRFAMLLVPPFAIAFGVALGRLYEWLQRQADRVPAAQQGAARALALLLALGVLLSPLRQGYATAQAYVPRVHDAWWHTLERIRDETPADTIVSTWWPYGYWVKYAAERRVSADGGSLPTHVPQWLARALLAGSDLESLGLLRMLACGSDATPQSGNERGACKRINQRGVDVTAAHRILIELARRDRESSDSFLREQRLPEVARPEILAATHCEPPPAYLILSNEMVRTPGWKYLGAWGLPESDPGSRESYLTASWVECAAGSQGERVCPLSLAVGRSGAVIDTFAYRPDAPSDGHFNWRRGGDLATRTGKPAVLHIADASSVKSLPFRDAIDASVAVLLDVAGGRVLVGSPALLRSTFTHLMFLDGRYTRAFEKFDDRTGYRGERVVTWKVNWPPERASFHDESSRS